MNEELDDVLFRMSDLIAARERLALLRSERLTRDAEIKWLERRVQAAEYLLKCQEQSE